MHKILFFLLALYATAHCMESDIVSTEEAVASPPSPRLATASPEAKAKEELDEKTKTMLNNSIYACLNASTAYLNFAEELNGQVQRFLKIIKGEVSVTSWPALESSIKTTFSNLAAQIKSLPRFLNLLTTVEGEPFYDPSCDISASGLLGSKCSSNEDIKTIAREIAIVRPIILVKMQEISDCEKALEESFPDLMKAARELREAARMAATEASTDSAPNDTAAAAETPSS